MSAHALRLTDAQLLALYGADRPDSLMAVQP